MSDAPNIIGIVLGAASFVISVFVGIVVARAKEDRETARAELKDIVRRHEAHDQHRTEAAVAAASAADLRTRLTTVDERMTAVEQRTNELAEKAARAEGASSASFPMHSVDNKMDVLTDAVRGLTRALSPVIDNASAAYHSRTGHPHASGMEPEVRVPPHDPTPSPGRYPPGRPRLPSRGGE